MEPYVEVGRLSQDFNEREVEKWNFLLKLMFFKGGYGVKNIFTDVVSENDR